MFKNQSNRVATVLSSSLTLRMSRISIVAVTASLVSSGRSCVRRRSTLRQRSPSVCVIVTPKISGAAVSPLGPTGLS